MSFPRYPKYKESGVEWLGEVPEHWRFGSLTRIASRVVVGIAEAATHAYVDNGIPILRSTNIRPGIVRGEILHVDPEFASERGSKQINVGDLVTVRTGNAGVTAVIPNELDGCQCFTMLVTTLDHVSHAQYYCYWMNSVAAQCYFNLEGWGTAQVNISVPILKSLPVPLPPTFEQTTIAAFLDRETAKIDALVAEQRRLMELLKEKRQAVISHAVTKGLDPHAPMKPSGIEWLGDVPAHWAISRLSYETEILAGYPFDASLFGFEGTPIIRMSNFCDGKVDLSDAKRVIERHVPEGSLARDGDILLGLSGSISNFAIVGEKDLPIAINQRVAIVRSSKESRNLIVWFLQSPEFLNQLVADLPSTTILNISMGDLRRCKLPAPPSAEQSAIDAFLDEETAKIDVLTIEAQRAIDLLQERRAALISAAVTGQIDVREEVLA